MTEVHEWECDGPKCEERIAVGEPNEWLILKGEADDLPRHYCSWRCLDDYIHLELIAQQKGMVQFIEAFKRMTMIGQKGGDEDEVDRHSTEGR